MKCFAGVALVIALFGQAAIADTNIHCIAKGDKSGGNDAGSFMVDADLHLILSWDKTAKGHVLSGTGTIKVGSPFDDLKSPEELTEDNAYIGVFTIINSPENTNYRPRKYKGFMQFPDFDAASTTGLEDGMWGSFLVQRTYKTAPRFQAKYIFKAGDHMGGTLHLTCSRE